MKINIYIEVNSADFVPPGSRSDNVKPLRGW
jgi:hypothetical protein